MALLIEHLDRAAVRPLVICPGPGPLAQLYQAADGWVRLDAHSDLDFPADFGELSVADVLHRAAADSLLAPDPINTPSNMASASIRA